MNIVGTPYRLVQRSCCTAVREATGSKDGAGGLTTHDPVRGGRQVAHDMEEPTPPAEQRIGIYLFPTPYFAIRYPPLRMRDDLDLRGPRQ